ncbi:MAG: recombinase family protein [Acetobacteraceae bacterium]|nr:recombinase family protein [Acetobacteraceae bacterium]
MRRGGAGRDESVPARAAAYVRMSTEHQQYSIENQSEAIRRYAEQRGIEIVRIYADHGKSGLTIAGRDGLQRLIRDVQSGAAGFSTILVYDVSRWGRFQDPDEAGHYEFICKRAGITIQFCAEQFENDGSAASAIIKDVKRVMSREYSRELSTKVFAGQCRLIELGFRQGGPAGYGLRRHLVDGAGTPKGTLSRGEQKSIQTDRVVLVPGPPEEVEAVRWIYRAFVEEGRPEREIAEILNGRGLRTDLGRPWTRGTVHQVLINEKYAGDNVWNRVSSKLMEGRIRNPRHIWVRRDGAFEPVVDRLLFEAAQAIVRGRSHRLNDEEMLEALRRLLAERGRLSGLIIDEAEGLPSSSAYQSRFGSLLHVYQLVGFTPKRDYRYLEINRLLRRLHPEIVTEIIAGISRVGGYVVQDPATDLLTINGELSVSVVVVRRRETAVGAGRWHIRLDAGLMSDLTVAVRMDRENRAPLDYFILPSIDMFAAKLQLAEHNEAGLETYRFDDLGALYDLTGRIQLKEVA